jgi:hypothetical protein
MTYKALLRRYAARRAKMVALRRAGWLDADIARRFRISRARVGQILGARS